MQQTITTLLLALALAPAALAAVPLGYTRSPTSAVTGKSFNRFVTIWLENTDYDKAAGDPSLLWVASKGITLTNYFAVTHPSEPNYIASVGGEYFGIDNDDPNTIPSNVSSIADLLEDKGITWGLYQEDMPYSGFTGADFKNPVTKANDYVRKHNPLVMFGSVASDPERLALIKNLTYFEQDLANKALPQWMFITPNMTSDGHDTSVTVAGAWTRKFLEPLLTNEYFMKDTLILVTFDENHSYTSQNRVFSILLGGAVPKGLIGTTDSAFYNHYSEIATVAANWDLYTLGRFDVGANVFSFVAKTTKDVIRTLTNLSNTYLNESYPGIFNSKTWAPMPRPNTGLVVNGRTVLPKVKATWGSPSAGTVYAGSLDVPSAANPPKIKIVTSNETVHDSPALPSVTANPSFAEKVHVGKVLCTVVGMVWLTLIAGIANL